MYTGDDSIVTKCHTSVPIDGRRPLHFVIFALTLTIPVVTSSFEGANRRSEMTVKPKLPWEIPSICRGFHPLGIAVGQVLGIVAGQLGELHQFFQHIDNPVEIG